MYKILFTIEVIFMDMNSQIFDIIDMQQSFDLRESFPLFQASVTQMQAYRCDCNFSSAWMYPQGRECSLSSSQRKAYGCDYAHRSQKWSFFLKIKSSPEGCQSYTHGIDDKFYEYKHLNVWLTIMWICLLNLRFQVPKICISICHYDFGWLI